MSEPHGERRYIAVHEAGHAVVAIALGMPVEKATIIPGRFEHDRLLWSKDGEPRTVNVAGKRYGGCVFLGSSGPRRGVWERHALVTFAGPLAEISILGGTSEASWKIHRRQALASLRRTTPPKRIRAEWSFRDVAMMAWGEDVLAAARNLVDQHRAQIERVADALIEHETLSGEAIAALVREAAA